MKAVWNIGEILGAIIASKMTGDIRIHSGWTLKLIAALALLAYLIVRQ